MTDYRNLADHYEADRHGLADRVLLAFVALCQGLAVAAVMFAVMAAIWMALPGAKTVDDVLQIEPPAIIAGAR